jgi:pimeloyl-ACP methyl ester carboxylesterase
VTVREFDVALPDGRTLHGYDTGGDGVPVVWHHGTPNVGAPPRPLLKLADEIGLRWVSFDRPGYGGSTANSGRSVAAVVDDVVALADELEFDRFAVMGHSGGGPHALACAAALVDRVLAVVSIAGLAPIDADDIDWFEGMGPTSSAALRAAQQGEDVKRRHEEDSADAPVDFIARDWSTLTGPWGWLTEIAAAGVASGLDGLVDDDVAYVTPWAVDLTRITAPVLFVHGGNDHVVPASHSAWLEKHVPDVEYWRHPDEGHLSVLAADSQGADDALRWIADHVIS